VLHRRAIFAARQDRAFIETKPVDVQFAYVIAQAVQDELLTERMIRVERVAHAAKILVRLRMRGIQDVISAVVDPPEAKRRSKPVGFAGVIEDHVQDHFDACLMQSLYHVAKLVHVRSGGRTDAVSGMRPEKIHRVVAPKVRPPLALRVERSLRLIEFEDRQQLYGSYSKSE
jgi:hypothetical protein